MKDKWSSAFIAEICDGEILQNSRRLAGGFSIDTRTLQPDDVYVALVGETHDGHSFVEAAVQAGASILILSKVDELTVPDDVAVVKVKDTLKALQDLAEWQRMSITTEVIAVTGSNGKTTTRTMLHYLLSEVTTCDSTKGNLNNHIGLPMTVLGIDPANEYAVVEMGMNHPGEIRALCKIAKPSNALICNVGSAHIGILGSLENIARAKAEILEDIEPGKFSVAPGDSEFIGLLKGLCPGSLITFGESANNDYRVEDIVVKPENVSFKISSQGESASCTLPLAGRHNALNAAAALTMYNLLGYPLSKGCKRLESFKPVGARMEKIAVENGITVLLDCYNANPPSMKEALTYLSVCGGNKIAVLGDMRELGSMSKKLHRQIGSHAAACKPDLLICVGVEAEEIAKAAVEDGLPESAVIALNSDDETAELLRDRLTTGSTVLFKASRGMHFEKIVQKLWPELGKELH